MSRIPARLRALLLSLAAGAGLACGNPIQIATWLTLEPGSEVDLGTFAFPLEGGVFVRIDVDLADLLHPRGTITVDQVRIGGYGPLVEYLCLRRDDANAASGSFEIDLLAGTQDVDFPLATIGSSSFFDALGLGEFATVAAPEGLAFPTDVDLAPYLQTSRLDGLLTLPVSLAQSFEVQGFVFPATVDLVLTASSRPPEIQAADVLASCTPKWTLQAEPLSWVLNPRSTYLHHVNEDALQDPLVIDLAEVGAVPGDTLVITTGGKWNGFFQKGVRVAAVFSSSDVLLPVESPALWTVDFLGWLNFASNRVAGAIEAGPDVVTPLSFGWLNRTDIPQDFEVTGSRQVVVPAGATHLFVTPIDNHFSDNLSADLRVALALAAP